MSRGRVLGGFWDRGAKQHLTQLLSSSRNCCSNAIRLKTDALQGQVAREHRVVPRIFNCALRKNALRKKHPRLFPTRYAFIANITHLRSRASKDGGSSVWACRREASVVSSASWMLSAYPEQHLILYARSAYPRKRDIPQPKMFQILRYALVEGDIGASTSTFPQVTKSHGAPMECVPPKTGHRRDPNVPKRRVRTPRRTATTLAATTNTPMAPTDCVSSKGEKRHRVVSCTKRLSERMTIRARNNPVMSGSKAFSAREGNRMMCLMVNSPTTCGVLHGSPGPFEGF